MTTEFHNDPFGQAMFDYYHGKIDRVKHEGWETTCKRYFDEIAWFDREKKAIQLAKGKILDIGCSVGRHVLYLQRHGYDVVGIDNSPLSIAIAKKRGIKNAKVVSITQLSYRTGVFDTIIMFGNNFGLVGTEKRAKWVLRRFKRMTTRDALILAGYGGDSPITPSLFEEKPDMKNQCEENIASGKFPGEVTHHVHYGEHVATIPWLYISTAEFLSLLDVTGWWMQEKIQDGTGACIAVLAKT
jgi:SAM-dependent methyltransferase